ncbi:MAG: hypothetical protein JWO53_313 [Chlamydiia bacterium]|nr:hypothetical protein [Chlamydiia bacterium]
MRTNFTNFEQRAFLGAISACVISAAIFLSHTAPFQYLFLLLVGATQAVALWEYYRLSEAKGYTPLTWVAIPFSALYILFHFFSILCPHCSFYTEGLLYLFAVSVFISYFKRQEKALGNLAVTIFGFIYITIPLSLLLDLNFGLVAHGTLQNSLWLLFLIITTKMTDTVAYFTGKKFGKHKIASILSPKKTVEGTIGGVIGAACTGLAFFYALTTFNLALTPTANCTEILILSLFIGITGILGDLAESLLKRDAQVKDSNGFPGFGGILDMVDSTLLTAPLLYIYLKAKMIA